MSIAPECYPCVMEQALSAIHFAQLDSQQSYQVLEHTLENLQLSRARNWQVQHITRKLSDQCASFSPDLSQQDLYHTVKKLSLELTLPLLTHWRQQVQASQSPLHKAIHLAAAGNIIDFGALRHHQIDVASEVESLEKTPFDRYEIDALLHQLSHAKTLLYLADNVGELTLDRLLIETLLSEYPQLQITVALRDRPILNDATLQDAQDIGLPQIVHCISSGSIYPGTVYEETSEEFQKLFRESDLILSKGQGNFETLFEHNNPNLFFLLRIKCPRMERLSHSKQGFLALIQSTQTKESQ